MEAIKKYLPPLIIVVVAVFVALFFNRTGSNAPAKEELDKSTWHAYTDEVNGFEIRFPGSYGATKGTNRVYVFDNNSKSTAFEVVIDSEFKGQESDYHNIGFSSSGKVQVDTKSFTEIKAPNGFCEEGRCGRPFSAYTIKHNEKFYTIVFYGNDTLSPQEKYILGTLVFK